MPPRAIFWYERDQSEFLYEGSYWKRGFVGGNYQFLKDEGMGGRHLDARVHTFYMATVNTPAMAMKLIGAGSQYAWGYLDANGNALDGSKNYKINLPKDPPALKFISVVVYDPQTRSELQTGQPYPSKNSARDKMIENEDGSIDLYFGPEAPAGKEANWIQTVPGKGWFSSCVFIAQPKPGLTRPGVPVRLNWWGRCIRKRVPGRNTLPISLLNTKKGLLLNILSPLWPGIFGYRFRASRRVIKKEMFTVFNNIDFSPDKENL